jgi:hypothetical protein
VRQRTRRSAGLLAVALVAASLLSGCSVRRHDAAQALADARAVLGTVREDAARYLPDDLATLDVDIAALDARLQAGDVDAVFNAVPRLTDRLDALHKETLARRARAAFDAEKARVEWSALAADLSDRFIAVDARIAELTAQRRLPAGMERAKFEAAKQSLAQVKAAFKEAASSETGGAAPEAVTRARAIAQQLETLATQLGVSAPAQPAG